MRPALYDFLCAVLLGLGNMCLFMGYDTQLTIVEPVLRSVHDRSPLRIDAHAGFYGAGLCTVFFTFASLISPWVLGILGSKYTLLVGSLLFTLHLATFQYVHALPYYITSAMIGIGYALFYSGHGGYLTEHSTKKTIQRNSALTWAITTSCTIAGGCVLALTARRPALEEVTISNASNATLPSNQAFRSYSDEEIQMMYGAFTVISILANLLFVFIPAKNVANSISARFGRTRIGFSDQMKKIYHTFTDVRAIELIPLFCFIGINTCFWCTAFPTTLLFTKSLSDSIYLPAFYLITFGMGEIIMGITISIMSKKFKTFAQMPALVIGSIIVMVAMVLSLLSIPPSATNSPTDDGTLLLQPSPIIVLSIALLLGMADNCICTARTVLCALVIPGNVAQVYSMSKFFQALTSAILFFVAPLLSMPAYFAITSVFCIFSLIFYSRVAKKTRRAEKEEDRIQSLKY